MKQPVLHTDVLAASIAASHYASTLQDGGVGFNTMLIGFSLDFSHPQSCPAVRIKPISVWAANYGWFCLQKSSRRLSR